MTRVGLCAALAVAAVLGVAEGHAVAREPARVQVGAREFTLTLSRLQVMEGPVIVELVNRGEDDHDLALRRRATSATTRRIPRLGPGGMRRLELRLAKGRYALWCTLGDHRRRGMAATLVVLSAKRKSAEADSRRSIPASGGANP